MKTKTTALALFLAAFGSTSAFAASTCYERAYGNGTVKLVDYKAFAQEGGDVLAAARSVLTEPIRAYSAYPTLPRTLHRVAFELIENGTSEKLGHLTMTFNDQQNVTRTYSAIYQCNLIEVLDRTVCTELGKTDHYAATFTILGDTEKNSYPALRKYDLVADSTGKYDTRQSPLVMYSHGALEAPNLDAIIDGDLPFSVIAPDEFRMYGAPCAE